MCPVRYTRLTYLGEPPRSMGGESTSSPTTLPIELHGYLASPPDALVTERKLGARTSPRMSGRKFQKSTVLYVFNHVPIPRSTLFPLPSAFHAQKFTRHSHPERQLPNLIIASAFPRIVQRPMLRHKTATNPERGGARRPPRRPEPTGAAHFHHIISCHVMSYHIVAPRCSVFPS